MLAAADDLFRRNEAGTVTMDAVAEAAGVGKGTLFRAFGDRDGLLDALSAAKFRPLREAIEAGDLWTGPDLPAERRVVAFLDAVLTFKLDNRSLMRAREVAGASDLRSDRYRWMHATLRDLVSAAQPSPDVVSASYAAHTLLAALRIELLDEQLAGGQTPERLRHEQSALAAAVLRRRRADAGGPHEVPPEEQVRCGS